VTKTHAKDYDPEAYWAKRYSQVDVTRSGHIDLPAAYNLWLYRRKTTHLLHCLQRHGFEPRGRSVLEIATGSGVYVEFWKRLGISHLAGIDISEAATAAMRVRFPEFEFHKRDLGEPGLSQLVGTGFDLVTAIDMLYHVVDDQAFAQALANLAYCVAPGGLLAIHDIFLREGEREFGYMKLRNLARYTAALNAAGFDVLSRSPTFFFSVQWAKIDRPSTEKAHDWAWSRLFAPAIRHWPGATGAVTCTVDRALGAVLNEGPSFEMMVCRRRSR